MVLGIHRALEVIWLIIIVIVPLAFLGREFGAWSSVIGSFELPKIVALRALVGLMAALWLIEWAVAQARSSNAGASKRTALDLRPDSIFVRLGAWLRAAPTRWLVLAAAFFLGATLLSTLLSVSPRVSFWGEVPGQDSYSAYTTVAYVLLFAVIATHLKSYSQLWRLLGAIVVVGVLFSGYAVLQHYGHDFFGLMVPIDAARVTSTVSNPILAGAVMLMTILISLVGATITLRGPMRATGFWWKLSLWVLVLTVQLLGLLFTFSRGPWVGTAVALVVFIALLAALGHWRILVRASLLLLLAAAATSAIISLPSRQSPEEADDEPVPLGAGRAAELVASVPAQATGVGALGAPGLSGRIETWRGSWRLMTRHPWVGFDSQPLASLRPLAGYGPDFFHAAYLLVSPPRDVRLPSEFVHAHNYFVHQGVELGFLGLAASLAVFGTLLLVAGYQLLWQRKGYSTVHQLLLAGAVAIVAGRLLEQMVGIARVSDLTIFWVLLGVFVALPAIMDGRQGGPDPPSRARGRRRRPHRPRPGDVPKEHAYQWRSLGRLGLVCCLVFGIGVLTWVKGVNYVRAAVIADRAAEQFQAGNLQASLTSIERSIDLAPDVNSYYGNRSELYATIEEHGLWSQHVKCGGLAELQVRKACLAKEAYLGNVDWVDNRPLSWRSRIGLAGSALQLALATKDRTLAEEATRLHRETAEMVPNSYKAWDRLADVYIVLGQPQQALEAVEKSLAIIGDHPLSRVALLLQAEAYQNLGQIEQELDSLGRAITVAPLNPEPYYIRGSLYRLLGQHERAIEDLSQAISLVPAPAARNYYGRALAFAALGRDAEAREDLERAVDLGADRNALTAAIEELVKKR